MNIQCIYDFSSILLIFYSFLALIVTKYSNPKTIFCSILQYCIPNLSFFHNIDDLMQNRF